MSKNVVCFGEVLWDVFPNGERIGGAPLNVALRLNSLDMDSTIISKVGNDEYGNRLVEYLNKKGQSHLIQKDDKFKTGIVNVELDREGNANYDIEFPAAWDYIECPKSLKNTVSKADYFIYGSLISRNENSLNTLIKLLEVANYKVLDVNLRKPHYTMEILIKLMSYADFIKLNKEELDEVCGYLGESEMPITGKLELLSQRTNTNHICVTQGACGVTLYYDSQFYHNSGFKVEVKDTVGAGDSFLAGYIAQLIKANRPTIALDYACALGSLVASKAGANAEVKTTDINELIWND